MHPNSIYIGLKVALYRYFRAKVCIIWVHGLLSVLLVLQLTPENPHLRLRPKPSDLIPSAFFCTLYIKYAAKFKSQRLLPCSLTQGNVLQQYLSPHEPQFPGPRCYEEGVQHTVSSRDTYSMLPVGPSLRR